MDQARALIESRAVRRRRFGPPGGSDLPPRRSCDYQSPSELQFDKASVVYDGKTGKVVFVHQVATVAGGKQLSSEEVDREALKLANTLGTRGALKTLNVAPAALVPGEVHKVDLKRLTLVPPKRARRKRTAAGSSKPKR